MVYIPANESVLPEIYLHLENYEDDIPGKRMTLFFHKRLDASRAEVPAATLLKMGVREMQELIF
jgi:hypothetical protein